MTSQAIHVFIDLGSHKPIIVPPSRPNDNSSMVTKISGLTPLHQTTLLKSEQHKENSILTGLGRGTTPWVLLGSEWAWVMGFFITFPHFLYILAASNSLWVVMQKSAAWTVPEFMIFGGMEGWDELEMLEQFEMVNQLLLSRLRRWRILFLSLLMKIRHDWASAVAVIEPIPCQLQFLTSWGSQIGCL